MVCLATLYGLIASQSANVWVGDASIANHCFRTLWKVRTSRSGRNYKWELTRHPAMAPHEDEGAEVGVAVGDGFPVVEVNRASSSISEAVPVALYGRGSSVGKD